MFFKELQNRIDNEMTKFQAAILDHEPFSSSCLDTGENYPRILSAANSNAVRRGSSI